MQKKNNKNILIISHYYYPDNRVGAKRFGNLVKYFSSYYASVHVLTIPESQIPVKDKSLTPSGILHRTPMLPPYPMNKDNPLKRILIRFWEKHLCMLDHYSGWIIPALIKAIKVIKRHNIDTIIATAPPFLVLLVGVLASLFTGKKLIIDYRDPWTTHLRKFPSPFGQTINVASEKLAFKHASAIVFCSKIMETDFKKIFGRRKGTQHYVLTNGYTESAIEITPLYSNQQKVTMLYAGNFYGGRNLGIIAGALSNLIRNKIIGENNFEFIIYGMIPPQDRKIIQSFNLESVISVRDAIPYQEVLRYMKGADILFLPSAKEHNYAIPYKFFDYLMVKKRILAVAPKGSAVEELMREIPCGYFCPVDDPYAIMEALTKMIHNCDNITLPYVKDYTWPVIAEKYMKVIDGI